MAFVHGYTELSENCVGQLAAAIASELAAGAKSILLLAATGCQWRAEELDPILKNCAVPIFGGIFPLVITPSGCYSDRTLVLGLSRHFHLHVIANLSTKIPNMQSLREPIFQSLSPNSTLMFFADGLAKNVERLVEVVYEAFGSLPRTIGGGAGYLDFVQQPCVITSQGLLCDAALLAYSDVTNFPAFRHGWEIFDGPFLVTEAHENTLCSINFSPAFEFYKQRIEALSDYSFDENDFFDVAKNFPLGIASVDGDILVRDPLKHLGNDMVCVGELPQNSTVYILKGIASGLITASGEAAQNARTVCNALSETKTSALLFDCISRYLFLGDHYPLALDKIKICLGDNVDIFGVLSLGEIANSSRGPVELLNKTTLISLFSD